MHPRSRGGLRLLNATSIHDSTSPSPHPRPSTAAATTAAAAAAAHHPLPPSPPPPPPPPTTTAATSLAPTSEQGAPRLLLLLRDRPLCVTTSSVTPTRTLGHSGDWTEHQPGIDRNRRLLKLRPRESVDDDERAGLMSWSAVWLTPPIRDRSDCVPGRNPAVRHAVQVI